MSQFDNPYAAQPGYTEHAEPPKTSGLAITSLVCSLICCIPGLPALGALLGAIAMALIGSKPHLKGKGLAIAGLVLGLVLTLIQIFVVVRIFQGYAFFRDAPQAAIQPGFDGDITAFKENFGSAGKAASDAEAQAFIDELRNRYGEFQGSEIDFAAYQNIQQPQSGTTEVSLPWTLGFDSGRVPAKFSFKEDDQVSDDELVFSSIRVIDPDEGDLIFPPEAAPASESPETPNPVSDDEQNDAPPSQRK